MPEKEDKQEDVVVVVPDTYEEVDFSEESIPNTSSSP